jgi:hypothetical protein
VLLKVGCCLTKEWAHGSCAVVQHDHVKCYK